MQIGHFKSLIVPPMRTVRRLGWIEGPRQPAVLFQLIVARVQLIWYKLPIER